MNIIYGIIDILRAILAHNLAEYQYFSMRPGLYNNYHQISYAMQIIAKNSSKKTSKNTYKQPYLKSRFFESVPYSKIIVENIEKCRSFSILNDTHLR